MTSLYHSVRLVSDRCLGCVNCIKKCPTEAIRMREGKAWIIGERCIDCGECIRVCPSKAKIAHTDSLERLAHYRYNIVVPSPVLYTQFSMEFSVEQVMEALKTLGFDEVSGTAIGVDELTAQLDMKNLSTKLGATEPIISCFCPAVVRLIQVKYPALLDHLLPLKLPMEIAASVILDETCDRLGLRAEEIGLFYLSPCPAEITTLKRRENSVLSSFNVLSINQIYWDIMRVLVKQVQSEGDAQASPKEVGWAIAGGETAAFHLNNYLTVDGIDNVMSILSQVEMGKLSCIRYIETKACLGGCVGGALTVENQFIARRKVAYFLENWKGKQFGTLDSAAKHVASKPQIWAGRAEHRPVFRLDADVNIALKKMKQMEQIVKELPGLDCGACGAPTCTALAEDIVQDHAERFDCIFALQDEIRRIVKSLGSWQRKSSDEEQGFLTLWNRLEQLTRKIPPAYQRNEKVDQEEVSL